LPLPGNRRCLCDRHDKFALTAMRRRMVCDVDGSSLIAHRDSRRPLTAAKKRRRRALPRHAVRCARVEGERWFTECVILDFRELRTEIRGREASGEVVWGSVLISNLMLPRWLSDGGVHAYMLSAMHRKFCEQMDRSWAAMPCASGMLPGVRMSTT
jgi:hypothetical protein